MYCDNQSNGQSFKSSLRLQDGIHNIGSHLYEPCALNSCMPLQYFSTGGAWCHTPKDEPSVLDGKAESGSMVLSEAKALNVDRLLKGLVVWVLRTK
jgi:hypothetical protein